MLSRKKKDVNVNILRVNMLFSRDSFCFHSWFQPSLEQGGHSGLALFSPASNKQLKSSRPNCRALFDFSWTDSWWSCHVTVMAHHHKSKTQSRSCCPLVLQPFVCLSLQVRVLALSSSDGRWSPKGDCIMGKWNSGSCRPPSLNQGGQPHTWSGRGNRTR